MDKYNYSQGFKHNYGGIGRTKKQDIAWVIVQLWLYSVASNHKADSGRKKVDHN